MEVQSGRNWGMDRSGVLVEKAPYGSDKAIVQGSVLDGVVHNLYHIVTGSSNVVLAYRTKDEDMDRDEFTITVDYGDAKIISHGESIEDAINNAYKVCRHL